MRVYLTGASGLLGSHLAERLRARGDEVVCLLRPSAERGFLERLGCDIVEGDVREGGSSLEIGMREADAVVHGAALVYAGIQWPRLRKVNVEGTGNVLRAAARAGVSHAVHVSSVAVYGGAHAPVDETTPTDRPLLPGELYARSKREAEVKARTVTAETGLPVAIVRPCSLYGERDRMFAPRLARLVSGPIVPLLGNGGNTLPVVYAGNAAEALVSVLRAEARGVYDVTLDRPLTQLALLEGMAEALGGSPRFLRIPAGIVRGGARLGAALGLTVPGAGELTLECVARLALGENPFRSERVRRELGWEPPFEHEEGIRRTAAWIRRTGIGRVAAATCPRADGADREREGE